MIPHEIDVGIVIPRIGNMVPEYEEREAATYTQISWPSWLNMHWYDRAASVAQYRIHYLIEAHAHDAERRAIEKANRKRPKGRR